MYAKLITTYAKLMSWSLIFALLQGSFLALIVKKVRKFLRLRCFPSNKPWPYIAAKKNESCNLTYAYFVFANHYFISKAKDAYPKPIIQSPPPIARDQNRPFFLNRLLLFVNEL